MAHYSLLCWFVGSMMQFMLLLTFFVAFGGNFALVSTHVISDVLEMLDIVTPIDVRNKTLLENKCFQDIKLVFKDLAKGKSWARDMVDSSDIPSEGLWSGKRIFFGDFDKCIDIESPYDFNGQYCLVSLNSTYSTFKLSNLPNFRYPEYLVGSCLPSSCSSEYLNQVIKQLYITFNVKNVSEFVSLAIEPRNCQIKNQEVPYTTFNYFSMSVIALLLLLTAISSTYDLVFEKTNNQELTPLTAFSLVRNGRSLFCTDESVNGITGIRGLIASLVVCVHYIYFEINGSVSNLRALTVHSKPEVSGFVAYGNANLLVDMFFVLGGILSVKSFLSEINRKKSFNPVFSIVKRYFRVMVPAILIYVIHTGITDHLHAGPIYNEMYAFYKRNCLSTMTSFIFNYDNFKTNIHHMCLEHTWYIHVDMQLFVFSQFVFFICIWKPKAILKISLFLCIACSMLELYIALYYNLSYSIYCDPGDKALKTHYAYPYTRGTIYFAGMVIGSLLHKYEERGLPKVVKSGVWMFGLLLTCVGMYLLTFFDCPTYSQPISAISLVYRKLLVSIGVGTLMFSCFIQRNDLFSKIMSIRLLQFLGELSYEIYLIHVPIIILNMAASRGHVYLTALRNAFYSISFLGTSTLLAIAINLVISRPSLILAESMKNFWKFGTIRSPYEMSESSKGKIM